MIMKYKIQSIINSFGYNLSRLKDPDVDVFNYLCRYLEFNKYDKQDFKRKFISQCMENFDKSHSQRFQDILADTILNGEKGVFCEFGATDGISLSNSYFLEKHRGWKGILAEPAKKWHTNLTRNRPSAIIDYRCVFHKSGEIISFDEAQEGEYSSISHIDSKDHHHKRRINSVSYHVNTVTLNDLLEEHDVNHIDFLSIDTEGSEYSILCEFDFKKFSPELITIEHNYTDARRNIFKLLSENGYVRILSDLSAFDDWYVKADRASALRCGEYR